jgi:hypothetical protein
VDYLLYCFYGAKVAIAVKDFSLALRLLELAITMPIGLGNAIMLESWHLYQMVCPLSAGMGRILPRPLPQQLIAVHHMCHHHSHLLWLYKLL